MLKEKDLDCRPISILKRAFIPRRPQWSAFVRMFMITSGLIFLLGSVVLLLTTRDIAWSMLLSIPLVIAGLMFGPIWGAVVGGILLVAAALLEQAIGKPVISSPLQFLVAGLATSIMGAIVGQVSMLYFERGRLLNHMNLMLRRARGNAEKLRLAEETLRSERNLLRSLIEILPVSVYAKDVEGKKTMANIVDVRTTGYCSEEEIIGKTDYDLFPREVADQFSAHDRAVIERGAPILNHEEYYLRSDGQMRWLVTSKVPLLNADGSIVGLVGVGLDITERKAAEELVRKSLFEKEALIQEIHHRVRNNLNVISSLLNIQTSLIRTPGDAVKAFEYSRDRVMAIAAVHEEVYKSGDFGRIDIRSYVLPLAKSLASRYDASSSVRIVTDLENIMLDVGLSVPTGLILNELITNAFRHAFPHGTADEVRITFRRCINDSFEFSVSDNGRGISNIIEATEVQSLGLSIVHSLVRQINGTLTVTSDSGACFHVRFPADRIADVN